MNQLRIRSSRREIEISGGEVRRDRGRREQTHGSQVATRGRDLCFVLLLSKVGIIPASKDFCSNCVSYSSSAVPSERYPRDECTPNANNGGSPSRVCVCLLSNMPLLVVPETSTRSKKPLLHNFQQIMKEGLIKIAIRKRWVGL